MKFIVLFYLVINLLSCSKDELNCIARNAQGEEMYVVAGSDVCEEQVSTQNGEYCECN